MKQMPAAKVVSSSTFPRKAFDVFYINGVPFSARRRLFCGVDLVDEQAKKKDEGEVHLLTDTRNRVLITCKIFVSCDF